MYRFHERIKKMKACHVLHTKPLIKSSPQVDTDHIDLGSYEISNLYAIFRPHNIYTEVFF